ncbi:MAG: energy transducer TonB family protein [Limisphaerales bacterium]
MNSPPAATTSWSPQRWAWAVLLVFGVQVLLAWVLSDPAPIFTRPPRLGPTLNLIAGTAADRQLHESLTIDDPTLYALANRRGFSGAVWWDILRPTLHLPDWAEPPRWLQPRLETLGATFLAFARTHPPAVMTIADKPPAESAEIPVPNDLLATQSTVQVDGDLAARLLRSPLDLPSWPDHDFLTNTVVQVAIDAGGVPRAVVLLERSGLKAADQRALELARTARFEPVATLEPAAPLRTWGTLIFRWHVQPPPAAALPVAKP